MTYDLVKELTKSDYSQSHLPLKPRRKPKFLIDSSQKVQSFDLITPFTNLNLENGNNNNNDKYYDENNLNELDSLNTNSLMENDSSDRLNRLKVKKPTQRSCSKQASLDSKIEHIFEEADENSLNESTGLNGDLNEINEN
jgi:hypothetical protein